MAILLTNVGFQPLDTNGEIIPNGTVRINNYSDGTPVISFQDSSATIQNPYEVPLSDSGYAEIYLAGGEYEIILADSDGTTVRTIPRFIPFEGNNGGINYGLREEFTASAGQATYTSTDVPLGSVSVHKDGALMASTLYSVSGNVVTFDPVLDAGDFIIYEYSSEAISGGGSGAGGTIWDSATGYSVGDIVSYNGEVYVAVASSTNKIPASEPTYWSISKGSALWNVSKNYGTGDIVSYGSYIYLALATSIGQQPDTATTYWKNITLGMVWDSGKNYLIGDITTEGTTIYVALTDNINKQPSTNATDWKQALREVGALYSATNPYLIGDVVTKSGLIYICIQNGTGQDPATETAYWKGTNLSTEEIMIVNDTKASGTDGGTFTSGAWRTRDLNTVESNNIVGASLATNQITLPAGTYEVIGFATANGVTKHQARLYDTTGTVLLVTGTNGKINAESSSDETTTISSILGSFTLSGESDIELQHRCSSSQTTIGFGSACSFGEEVYSQIEIRKIA